MRTDEAVHAFDVQTGDTLRRLRAAADLTRDEVSDQLEQQGVMMLPAVIGRQERGGRSLSLQEAVAFANVYGVDVMALATGEQPASDRLDALATRARERREAAAVAARLQNLQQQLDGLREAAVQLVLAKPDTNNVALWNTTRQKTDSDITGKESA